MSITENFAKNQREVARQEEAKNTPQGGSIPEILSNAEESRLFYLYLDENGQHELGTKLLAGDIIEDELTKEDTVVLVEKRREFLEIKAKAQEAKEKIEADLDLIIEASSDLKDSTIAVGKKELSVRFWIGWRKCP